MSIWYYDCSIFLKMNSYLNCYLLTGIRLVGFYSTDEWSCVLCFVGSQDTGLPALLPKTGNTACSCVSNCINTVTKITWLFSFPFFLAGFQLVLRALRLQSRRSTAGATVHFALVILEIGVCVWGGVSQTIFLGLPQTVILLISASQEAKITYMSHPCPPKERICHKK
jgi:hypothetical protein